MLVVSRQGPSIARTVPMPRFVTRLSLVLALAPVALCATPAPAATSLQPGQLVVVDSQAFGGCMGGCGGLIAVDPATGAETALSDNNMPVNASSQLFNAPFALAIDASGQIVTFATFGMGGSCNNGCGGVFKVDPGTGAETLVSSNTMPINASSQYFSEPTGVAIDAAGQIIVADWGHCVGCGKVIKVDPVRGKEP